MDIKLNNWQRICLQFVTGLLGGSLLGIIGSTGLSGIKWSRFDRSLRMSLRELAIQRAVQTVNHVEPTQLNEREDPEAVAEELERRVKIACLVILIDLPKESRMLTTILESWGYRCSNISFIYRKHSLQNDENFQEILKHVDADVVGVDTSGFSENIQTAHNQFNLAAFEYLFDKYPDSHWYLRLYPKTFVIMENLRYFLYNKDYNAPVVYSDMTGPGELSLHGGVVLSREALKRFMYGVQYEICNTIAVRFASVLRDCMRVTRTNVVQPLDKENRHLFHSFHPKDYVPSQNNITDWSLVYRGNGIPGEVHPSEFSISFWHPTMDMSSELNYFLYYFSIYGVYDTYSMYDGETT